eukprot:gene14160-17214_t
METVNAQQLRRAFELRQRITEAGRRQQQPRLGVCNDRQQPLLMMAAGGLRRIGRHRDDPGVQATKERRDVIRPAGEQQHRTIAQPGVGLQGGGDGAGAQVEVAVTEDNALFGRLGKEAQR